MFSLESSEDAWPCSSMLVEMYSQRKYPNRCLPVNAIQPELYFSRTFEFVLLLILVSVIDSCHVENGGCDQDAICSHNASTNAVVCSCRTGYSYTDDASSRCTGLHVPVFDRCLSGISFLSSLDSCQVNNGGCDQNAICSHEAVTNAVVCQCRSGYTNTGCAVTVKCTGITLVSIRDVCVTVELARRRKNIDNLR